MPRGWHSFYYLLALALLALALLLLFLPGRARLPEGLALTMLDVGQGDAFVISADGCTLLIDAGGRPGDITGMGERVVIPYLKAQGVRELAAVFNTHPDNDHLGGLLAVAEQLDIDYLAMFNGYPDNENQAALLNLAAAAAVPVPVRWVAAGDELVFSEDLRVRVLSPAAGEAFGAAEVNSGSLALLVSYQDFDALLCGDLEGERLQNITAELDGKEVEVLQLPHHGSGSSYAPDWYAQFAPEAVLISVGRDNSYGHPGAEVVAYWERQGTPILRTDIYGSCRLVWQQGRLYYETALAPE